MQPTTGCVDRLYGRPGDGPALLIGGRAADGLMSHLARPRCGAACPLGHRMRDCGLFSLLRDFLLELLLCWIRNQCMPDRTQRILRRFGEGSLGPEDCRSASNRAGKERS